MNKIIKSLPFLALFLYALPAYADFVWIFPFGELAFAWLHGAGHAYIFVDYFGDIYVLFSTHSATPLAGNLGAGSAFAYYLQNVGGGFYDVWIDQGGSFFYVFTTEL